MSTGTHKRTKVFISYSHEDARWLQRLRVHLRPLEREHRIEIWDDTRIKPGSKWKEEIRQAIATAKVAVLLVSADFLGSDFIATDELPPLLSAAEEDGACILPVILSPSTFSSTLLAQFQAVNDPSKPLVDATRGEQEAVLVKVTRAIEASFACSEIGKQHSQETATTVSNKSKESKSIAGRIDLTKLSKLHAIAAVIIVSAMVGALLIAYRVLHKPAAERVLILHVANPVGQPLNDVVLSANGDSSNSATTDALGNTRLRLAPQTGLASEVTLQVVRAPQDLVFISPWNQRLTVRSIENETNVAEIVLVPRGHRMLLEYPLAALAMASRINAANDAKAGLEPLTEAQRQANLVGVANAFGLTSEEVDRAIRGLGEKTTDQYEAGLVALYSRNYPEAIKQLSASVAERKRKFEQAKSDLADAEMFLGQSLFEQGSYAESSSAYQEVVALRPDDDDVRNKLGVALIGAGEYVRAEQNLLQGLDTLKQTVGPDRFRLARRLNNLGWANKSQAKYPEAESLYRWSLNIWDNELRSEESETANCINNLASLDLTLARYAEAETLEKRALKIWEKQLGPDHPHVATALNNLAFIYQTLARYDEAKPLHTRALMIWEKRLGADHPETARSFNNSAMLLLDEGKYPDAEERFQRALEIWRKTLGSEHPDVARGLNNLAMAYQAEARYGEAENLIKEALGIWERRLGSEHPDVATALNNLGVLYQNLTRYVEAEPLHKRALAIREKHFGSQHPDVALSLNNLALPTKT